MKNRLFILTTLAGTLSLASCGGSTQNDPDAQTAENTTAAAGTMDLDSLLATADGLADRPVTVEAVCTHICSKGGGKLFLMGSDDTKTIRVEAGPKIGRFPQEVVNSIVTVSGTLREQRIDEAYLAKWEEQAKAQAAEKHAAGCDAEQKARGEQTGAVSAEDRITAFRERIAQRKAKEERDYLSFYYIDGDTYTIHE